MIADKSQTFPHFLQAEIAGKRGLVPGNFLEEVATPLPSPRNNEIEVFAADEDAMKLADAIIQKVCFQSSSKPLLQYVLTSQQQDCVSGYCFVFALSELPNICTREGILMARKMI